MKVECSSLATMHMIPRICVMSSRSCACRSIDTQTGQTRRTKLIGFLRQSCWKLNKAWRESCDVDTKSYKVIAYLLEISMQSESDRLKCFINFSPFDVLRKSLLKKFVMVTKKQLPRTTRNDPSGRETWLSDFLLSNTTLLKEEDNNI